MMAATQWHSEHQPLSMRAHQIGSCNPIYQTSRPRPCLDEVFVHLRAKRVNKIVLIPMSLTNPCRNPMYIQPTICAYRPSDCCSGSRALLQIMSLCRKNGLRKPLIQNRCTGIASQILGFSLIQGLTRVDTHNTALKL